MLINIISQSKQYHCSFFFIIIILIIMDPTKKKKVPPVPKFEISKEEKNMLKEKVDQFMLSIVDDKKFEKSEPSKVNKINMNPEPVKVQRFNQKSDKIEDKISAVNPNPAKPQPEKKKLTLSNINQKLANMMNSKKQLISKVKPPVEKIQSKPKEQCKRKVDMQLEYDPSMPNNYEFVKSFYQNPKPEQQKAIQQVKDPKSKSVNQMQIQQQQPIQESIVLQETQQKALKMMQKYGFKIGQGLGKNKQGITTPLTIKKTTDSSCIITQSSIPLNQLIKPQISAKSALQAFGIAQSKIIVLNNIVNIKELDEQVQSEIRQQCQKYSKIINWIVYLIEGSLQNVEGAFNIFTKLNQKYFNSNLISVRFYNQQLFRKFKLDEPLHQHISF